MNFYVQCGLASSLFSFLLRGLGCSLAWREAPFIFSTGLSELAMRTLQKLYICLGAQLSTTIVMSIGNSKWANLNSEVAPIAGQLHQAAVTSNWRKFRTIVNSCRTYSVGGGSSGSGSGGGSGNGGAMGKKK